MVAVYDSNTTMQLTVRMPDEVHKALKEIAEKEQRSLNAQIIYILIRFIEDYFKEDYFKSEQG